MIGRVDRLLWSTADAGTLARRWWQAGLVVVVAGPAYGLVMGSFALDSAERLLMMLYAAVKMPLLIFGSTLVCVPGFFVVNTVLGLRKDFGRAWRAVTAGQAAMTLALLSLAPVTRFTYFCGVDHRWALLVNEAVFVCAAAAAQVVIARRYRPLIVENPLHRAAMWGWIVIYAFVGIQMGWMLRPFVGTPEMPVTFLREEPFSNAYVVIVRLIVGSGR